MIYALKREYGFEITLHKITAESHNYETGARTPTIQTQKINRAILLPGHLQRRNEQTDPGFKYGGYYDTSTRQVMVDADDLGDFEIEVDDYFIWNEKRWQVSETFPYELDTAFILIVRMVEGSPRHMVSEIALENVLTLTHEAT
jgi:hypothetical protein